MRVLDRTMNTARCEINVQLNKTMVLAGAAACTVALVLWYVGSNSSSQGLEPSGAPVEQGPMASPFGDLPNGSVGAADGPAIPAASASSVSAIALSAEEQASLWDAVKDQPNARAEFRRLQHYAVFHKRFERWQEMKSGPISDERRALAQAIFDDVPAHLEREEMMAGEAMMVQMAMLEDLEPDPARREARGAQVRAQLEAQVSKSDKDDSLKHVDDQRKMEQYKAREAAILSQWQALPEAQRDKQALTEQLDAVRSEIFDAR